MKRPDRRKAGDTIGTVPESSSSATDWFFPQKGYRLAQKSPGLVAGSVSKGNGVRIWNHHNHRHGLSLGKGVHPREMDCASVMVFTGC